MHLSSGGRFADADDLVSQETKLARRRILNRQAIRNKLLKKMEQQGKTLQDLFNEIDTDGSGEIEPDEYATRKKLLGG